ncbi:multidrug effflux MFS transporter [Companilactobacillus keshanensis]|uniref:Bcr/CflA family efflux transporter n=1 Tax=Companilactobacillus keshanensis TaxID=2486003 RepID=A0ABW4BQV0_9LACO|nr:multidrug effflux MFS transporter [Companilactobacillus keshanensis]
MKNVQRRVPSLLLIIVLVGFPQISESIFTPVLPQISRHMLVDASKAQLTMSFYFVAFAIGVFFWGRLSDKIGRRRAMLWGIVFYLIGNMGLLISFNFQILLLSRFIQAFGASVGSVVTQTIMRESFNGVEGAKVFSKVGAAMALSPALGPLIGGIVQQYLGYRNVFSTLVVMGILVLLYSSYRLPETQVVTNKETASLIDVTKRLIMDSRIWSYGILIGGINGILFGYYSEAPFIFMNHFGFTSVQYGSLGVVLALASLLGAALVNYLVNYFKSETILISGLVFSVISSGLLLVLLKFDQPFILITGFFMIFLGLNTSLPIALNLALKGYEDIIGSASGIFSLGYYLIVSLLTYLVSLIHNGTITALPLFMFVLSIVMLVSCINLYVKGDIIED